MVVSCFRHWGLIKNGELNFQCFNTKVSSPLVNTCFLSQFHFEGKLRQNSFPHDEKVTLKILQYCFSRRIRPLSFNFDASIPLLQLFSGFRIFSLCYCLPRSLLGSVQDSRSVLFTSVEYVCYLALYCQYEILRKILN